jgi:type IV secretory pathway TraG/TraD family ATPase VirD4
MASLQQSVSSLLSYRSSKENQMVTYPIHVTRDGYKGSNPTKRAKAQATNLLANKLEVRINEILSNQSEPIHVYTYAEIASATSIDYDTVRDLGFSIDGGSGGFTAYKVGLTLEQALKQAAESKPK